MKRIQLATLALLMTSMSYGKSYPKLTEFMDENVTRVGNAMNATAGHESMDFGGNYEFKRIFLRFQALVGIDVHVAKLLLVPELELVFQKENQL